MAIKTFTTGEVLTAADTNTYLANSGLVYIKQQTVGSGVGSVTVSSAFSSTYDNYKITYSGGVSSTGANLAMTLGATAAGYYSSIVFVTYSTGAVSAVGSSNTASFTYAGIARTNSSVMNIDVIEPFRTQRTMVSGPFINNDASGQFAGFLDDATSYTAFTLTPGSGTLTGGTITVYGYRKG
jgi:hypothetical protein